MKAIYLTNTLTGKLEEFKSIKPGHAGLYVCGLTPSNHTHIGHARTFMVPDIMRRTLEACDYQLNHVQNFTDMDDNILKRATEENASPFYIAAKYMKEYFEATDSLNILRAHHYPRVTEHIADIVTIIKKLIDRKSAYVAANSDVYFSVRSFAGYGKLSGRKIEELLSGARIEVSEQKHDPLDFALWKSVPSTNEADVGWDSPWGKGRPGWHIECSAMSVKYLDQPFDIHGGGHDLVFPHHENEIAQSEAAYGKAFANVFVHGALVMANREKMSKSLGNFFALKDILERYDPMAVRYYLISDHYRTPMDFSGKSLEEAKSAFARIQEAMDVLLFVANQGRSAINLKSAQSQIANHKSKIFGDVLDCLCNDFHTPSALAVIQNWASDIFSAFKSKKLTAAQAKKLLQEVIPALDALLGLRLRLGVPEAPKEASKLMAQRETCRKKKDFRRGDEIRVELKESFGLSVEDTPYGPRLKKSGEELTARSK